jgi:hypothetical protein
MLLLTDNLSRCVKLFRETGGVYQRKTTGRPLKGTAAGIETAREIMQNAPHTSIRQLSQQTEPCVGKYKVGTCHKLLRKDVQLYPYCMTVVIEGNFHDFKINFFKLIAGFRQYKCSKVSTENFGTIF